MAEVKLNPRRHSDAATKDVAQIGVHRFDFVLSALQELTPRVEVLAPGCYVIATQGPSRYYGGDEALAMLISETIFTGLAGTTGLTGASVSVGVADGLFAAGVAAKVAPAANPSTHPSTRVLVVPPGASTTFLGPLPVSTLAEIYSPLANASAQKPTNDFIEVLQMLGLHRLADVAALKRSDLIGRFGTMGEWVHQLASQGDPRLSQPTPTQPTLSVETEIDPPAYRIDQVAFVAKSLADQLDTRLEKLGKALVCVTINAKTEHGETTCQSWRHAFRFSPSDVVDRVRWQLDGWRSARGQQRPSGSVFFIKLTATQTIPDEGRQLNFWGAQSENDERAERALQRVQSLVGFNGVTVGYLGIGRCVADLEQRLPFSTGRPHKVSASKTSNTPQLAPWPGRLGAPAPAEVLVEPEQLTVLDAHGEPVGVSSRAQLSAPPAVLHRADGYLSTITAWAGPWPLDERWWEPSERRRQARFQFVLDDGTAHLCVVEDGRWQREATYD